MKITKEMFWKLPQLSRVEYMLVKKELRDRSNVGVTSSMVMYTLIFIGYMSLLSLIGYLVNPGFYFKFISVFRIGLGAFTIAIVLGIILDIFLLIRETKKHKEIDERFFNVKK